jgi:hypothetical protein
MPPSASPPSADGCRCLLQGVGEHGGDPRSRCPSLHWLAVRLLGEGVLALLDAGG